MSASDGARAIDAAHRSATEAGEALYRDPSSGLYVFTEAALRARGSCCGRRCRHCPFPTTS